MGPAPLRVRALQHVPDRGGVPLATAGRVNPAGVQRCGDLAVGTPDPSRRSALAALHPTPPLLAGVKRKAPRAAPLRTLRPMSKPCARGAGPARRPVSLNTRTAHRTHNTSSRCSPSYSRPSTNTGCNTDRRSWLSLSETQIVNRRSNLTPDRRPILTPSGDGFWR